MKLERPVDLYELPLINEISEKVQQKSNNVIVDF